MKPPPDPKVDYAAAIEYSRGVNELVEEDAPLNLLLMFGLGACASPPTVSELGEIIGEHLKAASRGVAILRRRGWVKLVGDPEDTRKRRVRLTRRGEAVVSALHGALVSTAFRIVENALGRELGAARAGYRRGNSAKEDSPRARSKKM